jgi:hypothetical protein
VQKGIYEYARARAAHYSKVLFKEDSFQNAVENSRWRAFPLGLAMVAEAAEGLLRPAAGGNRQAQVEALSTLVLSIFDRYPVPSERDAAIRDELRAELARRLQLIGRMRQNVRWIFRAAAQSYFELMPIHENLRRAEFQRRNYMRVTMCNIHDELTSAWSQRRGWSVDRSFRLT